MRRDFLKRLVVIIIGLGIWVLIPFMLNQWLFLLITWVPAVLAVDYIKIEYLDTSLVTRVEVIDENGRSYSNWDSNNKVFLQLQDKQRTLKVFIKK